MIRVDRLTAFEARMIETSVQDFLRKDWMDGSVDATSHSSLSYFFALDRSLGMGYIKDFEEDTPVQCSLLPQVRYLEAGRVLS